MDNKLIVGLIAAQAFLLGVQSYLEEGVCMFTGLTVVCS